MEIDYVKRASLLEQQSPPEKSFWSGEVSQVPTTLDYESLVFVKTKKKLIRDFSMKWLGFSYPKIYFAKKKKKTEGIKYLNLKLISCKLYDYKLKKHKYAFKFVLRHHEMSMDFYIQDPNVVAMWISKLRSLCVMCDFLTEYNMTSSLIKGNISTMCWIQSKKTSKMFCAKMYSLQDEVTPSNIQANIEKQVVFNQMKALRAIDHPNVLKLKEVHEFQDLIVLVMEFITGSSLLKYILSRGRLSEAESAYIVETLLKTLQALHEQNILHRNLKPENILLDYTPTGTKLKLTDFGFSCTLDDNDQSTWNTNNNICSKCGTPGYMSPEILMNKKSTMAGDIFSMGAILFTCLTGEALFRGKSTGDIIFKNMEASYDRTSTKWQSLSTNAKDLIMKMTNKDPARRPPIPELLKHPFFISAAKNGQITMLRPFTVQDSVNNVQNSKNSLEESLAKRDFGSRQAIDVFQDLILPPSYWDFTKYGVSEVPEFYVDTTETFKESESSQKVDSLGSPNKNGLKVEMIKGSLSYLEHDQITPRFNLKNRDFAIGESLEQEGLDEQVVSVVIEGVVVSRSYQKCYTFPVINKPPFSHVQCSLADADDVEDEENDDGPEMLSTSRKLPELRNPVRMALESKGTLLERLLLDVAKK